MCSLSVWSHCKRHYNQASGQYIFAFNCTLLVVEEYPDEHQLRSTIQSEAPKKFWIQWKMRGAPATYKLISKELTTTELQRQLCKLFQSFAKLRPTVHLANSIRDSQKDLLHEKWQVLVFEAYQLNESTPFESSSWTTTFWLIVSGMCKRISQQPCHRVLYVQ